MFIPYRARIKITRIPAMTIIVALVCVLVYWAQERNEEKILASARVFCNEDIARDIVHAQKLAFPRSSMACDAVLAHIYLGTSPERHLAEHRGRIEDAGEREVAETFEHHYRNFVAQSPRYLTERLWRYSGGWNPLRLLSATISHGSWDHLIGNLFFFAAFAMVVETVIGPVLFLLVFLAMGLGSGALQNLLTLTQEGGAGLGLSGVVMGMMTLAAYFSPHVKIKFFYFFFLFIGVLSWPLWSVAAWYVFWNIWDYIFWREWIAVGFAAHLAGAAMGLMLGLALFRGKRHWVQEQLIPDDPTLKDDESWFAQFNAIAAAPVVMFFVFIYGGAAFLLTIYLIIKFFETFAVQVLLAAPAVAAAIQVYRMSRPPVPQWERYQKGLAALDAHQFQEALKYLEPLAHGGYSRAQFALGRLHATRPGGYRNDAESIRWFRAAAQRGLSQAQLDLGQRHLHGHQLPKDLPLAIAWLEKAAAQGVGEAASSLGHIYEHALGNKADKEKAIEWYYRAGVAFHKAGQYEDAQTMLSVLISLTRTYPAVAGLVTELQRLCALKAGGAQA